MAFLINPQNNAPILSPDAIARRRKVSDAYLTASRDTAPIQSWTQGAAKLADALIGGLQARKADEMERGGREGANASVAKLVAAMTGTRPTVNPGTPPVPAAGAGGAALKVGNDVGLGDIFGVAQNPFLSDAQGGIVSALLKQKMDASQPREPIKLGAGDTLYDPGTGKPIFTAPAKASDRQHGQDEYGIDRYFDTGEPVFKQPGPPGNYSIDNPSVIPPANGVIQVAGDPPVGQRLPLFRGTTLQAQALNQMYMDGMISKEEAVRKAISDEAFRPLTDPQQRAYYGIGPEDKTPYLIDTDGKVTAIGGGGTTVNVAGNEKEYDRTVGGGLGKEFLDLNAEARKATESLTSLASMEQAMSDPNFYSGPAAETVLAIKRGIATLGGDPSIAASAEAFNAQAKKAALDNMGGSLGTGFSNADRDFVVDQVPSLANTSDGNLRLITINKAIQQRKIDIAQLARDYAKEHGGRIDIGFDDALRAFAEAHPLFKNEPPVTPPSTAAPPVTIDGVTIQRMP